MRRSKLTGLCTGGRAALLIGAMALTLLAAADACAQAAIDWHTLDNGGGVSDNANGLVLHATIGQPDAGPSAGDELLLVGGLWGGGPPSVLFADGFESPAARFNSTEDDDENHQ